LDTAADWYGFYHSYARSLHAFGVRKADMVMAAFSYRPWVRYLRAVQAGAAGGPQGGRARQGHQAADHMAYRRARRIHPGDQGEDRDGVRRPRLRFAGAHGDRRLGPRMRRAPRAPAR